MDLHYKGINSRTGRVEWTERDLAAPIRPDGLIMEEWQVEQYRPFVEGIRACIGRDLTKEELSTIAWLAGYEKSTIASLMNIIESANLHGRTREEKKRIKN